MSRKQKSGHPIKRSDSAALVPEEAGLPTRGGGQVGQPPWAPDGVDLIKVPEPVRQAVAEIIEPAYRQMVAEVEDPLERSIGLTLVHLMWLEVLDQHEAKQEYLQTSILELPEDRSDMIDRHLRMLHTKVKVGSLLMRLREMRRQSEAAAQPPQELSVTRSRGGESRSWEIGAGRSGEEVSETATRPGGEAEGECGKGESCHPRKQVSVDRDQVSVTRPRGGQPRQRVTSN